MKTRIFVVFSLLILMFLVTGCPEKHPKKPLTAAEALNNYWDYQTQVVDALTDRDATMDQITAKILAMGNNKNGNAHAEIEQLIGQYMANCDAVAAKMDNLIKAEESIVAYGDKGILGTVAKGVYNAGKSVVVNSGRMVRSAWQVMTFQRPMIEVLKDPNSGIPIVSNCAEVLRNHYAKSDQIIVEAILNWNPATSPQDTDNSLPYDQLPGDTPQEKAFAYLNLSDDDPMKKETRFNLSLWSSKYRQILAESVNEFGSVAVKLVSAAYAGTEVLQEVYDQHVRDTTAPQQTGTVKIRIQKDSTGNPPITEDRKVIISQKNTPEHDPRITIVDDPPENYDQPLPPGQYSIIVLADGFVREVYETVQVVKDQVVDVIAKLRKLADNPIIIEDLTVSGGVTVGEKITAQVSCVSTMGSKLSFDWSVTGGTYRNFKANGTSLSFVPTEQEQYTISVTVSDDHNNQKVRSVELATMGGKLAIDDWEFTAENIRDNKLNPGEKVTVKIYVSNTGDMPITGSQLVVGSDRVSVQSNPTNVTIAVGETKPVSVQVELPVDYSEHDITLTYQLTTQNANQTPVVIADQISIPVEFYVTVDPITQQVTNRITTITGVVANPKLGSAILVVDGNFDEMYEISINNSGRFSQNIVLKGSQEEEEHTVTVIAVSGAWTAEESIVFSSLIPVMALRVTLTWNTNGTDVDLWVTDPNGEKCYYANRTTASGLRLDVDDTNGYGPENITTSTIIPGDYLVQVHYYSDHGHGGVTNCQVAVQKDELSGQPPVNYHGAVEHRDLWTVTVLHYDEVKGWSFKDQDEIAKVDSSTLPTK